MPASEQPDGRYRIHHYPATLIETRARRSRPLTLRPILPQDADLLARLVDGLAPVTRRNRFHGAIRLSADHLRQMSALDYRSHLALVVTIEVDETEQLIADARYVVDPGGRDAEFALLVADGWQRQGVGTWAMQSLQRAATNAGLRWLHGDVLRGNLPMLGLMQQCGFSIRPHADDDQMVNAQWRLGAYTVPPVAAKHGFRSWLRHAWPASVQAAAP